MCLHGVRRREKDQAQLTAKTVATQKGYANLESQNNSVKNLQIKRNCSVETSPEVLMAVHPAPCLAVRITLMRGHEIKVNNILGLLVRRQ